MKTLLIFRRFVTICLLSTISAGCALLGPSEESPVIERTEMKVTAYTGGKKLANPEKELVHRLDVSAAEFGRCQQLFSVAYTWMRVESDSNGESAGVRVIGSRAMGFGLQRGDLLMSINQTRVNNVGDVSAFCPALISSKTVNMSVVRNSETHEIYLTAK